MLIDADLNGAGAAGGIGRIERVVDEFFDDQPWQLGGGDARALWQGREAGVERPILAGKK